MRAYALNGKTFYDGKILISDAGYILKSNKRTLLHQNIKSNLYDIQTKLKNLPISSRLLIIQNVSTMGFNHSNRKYLKSFKR